MDNQAQVNENAEAEAAAVAAAKAAAAAEKAAEKERKAQERAEAKAAKEAEKAEKAAAREAAKAEAAAAKAAKEAEKAQRVRQNGVLQPLADSKCGQAWAIFDEVSQAKGGPATIAESLPLAEERGLNTGNLRAEYGNWRKFYGVPVQPRAKKAEAPAAPAEAPAEEGSATDPAGTDYHDGQNEQEAVSE